jgi:hypothetical protein
MADRPLPQSADIARRVRRAIVDARAAAVRRRERVTAAEVEGQAVLEDLVSPLCKKVASVLAAEGHRFAVSTPVGAVRISRGTSGDDFVEIGLDTSHNPPALVGRAAWVWGQQMRQVERVVAEHPDIGLLTADQVLDYLLAAIAPLVAR